MKFSKILMLALSLCVFKASAQSTYPGTPLFGINSSQDNTGRALTYFNTTIGDTVGATPDTITIIPNGYNKYYTLNLKDSAVLSIKTVATSFIGNEITVNIVNGAVSGWVQFIGYSGLASQWTMISGTTKISPTASHNCVLIFRCLPKAGGYTWAEISNTQL